MYAMRLHFAILGCLLLSLFSCQDKSYEKDYVIYEVDPKQEAIEMYYHNEKSVPIRSLGNLQEFLALRNKEVIFAMNGGMFEPNNIPKGLYIENGQELQPLDTLVGGKGNFYLPPNGVFYVTEENKAEVVPTSAYKHSSAIKYATQSGPMLLIDGQINKEFTQGSINLNIRNGVGIRPTGEVVFAMSKEKVNFYDFAKLFQEMGCIDALYLDGFVSRAYLPSKGWTQTDGDFGVIIGIAQSKK